MRKVFSLCFCLLASTMLFAQAQKLTGTVVDAATDEPLVGVTVIEAGTTNGVVTDLDGNFKITVTNRKLQFSYVGYAPLEMSFKRNDIGIVKLEEEAVALQDVTITGQIARQQQTPVAVSQISALEIEERLAGQEFPEVLKNTPGVHANGVGGGWGDSEIWMRGFDNTNVATMINGVPMNDMEGGTVYWSNWQGLSDVTSVMQTQRGMGASKLSAPSVGGTINIVTRGIDAKKGGMLSYAMGNDGYNKVLFSVSTGLMKTAGRSPSWEAAHGATDTSREQASRATAISLISPNVSTRTTSSRSPASALRNGTGRVLPAIAALSPLPSGTGWHNICPPAWTAVGTTPRMV